MSDPEQSAPSDQRQTSDATPRRKSPVQALRQINARMVLGVLSAVALIVFIAQNTDDTQVNFLAWDWDLPLFLLLLITIALSVVCTEFVGWRMGRRKSRTR